MNMERTSKIRPTPTSPKPINASVVALSELVEELNLSAELDEDVEPVVSRFQMGTDGRKSTRPTRMSSALVATNRLKVFEPSRAVFGYSGFPE